MYRYQTTKLAVPIEPGYLKSAILLLIPTASEIWQEISLKT
jgi:hypothetical protein